MKTLEQSQKLAQEAVKLLLKQSQAILTIFYILLIAIGMVFKYQKYSHFGINIFQYADILDFLVAPFEDLTIIVFTLVSLSIPVFLFWLDIRWKKYKPVSYSKATLGLDKRSWYNSFRYFVFGISFIFYIIISGQYYGIAAKKSIDNQSGIRVRYVDNEFEEGKMIGKTKDVLFMLRGDTVKVIPLNSLVKELIL